MFFSSNRNKSLKKLFTSDFKDAVKHKVIRINSLSSFLRIAPNFFIAGSLKCGTTSLYNYLIDHKSILASIQKEAHYFDHNYDKGFGWYKGNFPISFMSKKTIDASPTYLFCKNTPNRILEDIKKPKVIFLFRNPVERSISHYNYISKISYNNNQVNSFETRINNELNWLSDKDTDKLFQSENLLELITTKFPLLGYGMYSKALKNWINIFKKEDILFINSHNFFKNEKNQIKDILHFLELENELHTDFKIHNKNEYQKTDSKIIERISDYFYPLNKELEKMTGIKL